MARRCAGNRGQFRGAAGRPGYGCRRRGEDSARRSQTVPRAVAGGWCRRRGSNPHSRKENGILSPARLPVPPLRPERPFYREAAPNRASNRVRTHEVPCRTPSSAPPSSAHLASPAADPGRTWPPSSIRMPRRVAEPASSRGLIDTSVVIELQDPELFVTENRPRMRARHPIVRAALSIPSGCRCATRRLWSCGV
jgi:hypothetical protein